MSRPANLIMTINIINIITITIINFIAIIVIIVTIIIMIMIVPKVGIQSPQDRVRPGLSQLRKASPGPTVGRTP